MNTVKDTIKDVLFFVSMFFLLTFSIYMLVISIQRDHENYQKCYKACVGAHAYCDRVCR